MRWTLSWDELEALQELEGGVCVEPNAPIWERLIEKGLADPDAGLVRSSVAGEVVLEAIGETALEPNHTTVVTLDEEPWSQPEPALPSIENFF